MKFIHLSDLHIGKRVNEVSQTLFKKYRTAEDYANASQEEFEDGKNAIKILGGKVEEVFEYTLASSPESVRNIIVIKKIKNTPEKYPREYKKILKSPL